jgi:hypothetical protein
MSRFYGAGVPITVETDEAGQPCRIVWEGQVWETVQVADSWRVDEDWWDGRVWREYFRCELILKQLMILVYHDLRIEAWYLQRVYD